MRLPASGALIGLRLAYHVVILVLHLALAPALPASLFEPTTPSIMDRVLSAAAAFGGPSQTKALRVMPAVLKGLSGVVSDVLLAGFGFTAAAVAQEMDPGPRAIVANVVVLLVVAVVALRMYTQHEASLLRKRLQAEFPTKYPHPLSAGAGAAIAAAVTSNLSQPELASAVRRASSGNDEVARRSLDVLRRRQRALQQAASAQ